jgi:hypothetical protein
MHAGRGVPRPPDSAYNRLPDCMMNADDFRELALDLHGATERAHMGHPDFRANGRIFASLQADNEWATLKLAADEQRALTRMHKGVFVPASGAWGKQGWTKVRLSAAEDSAVRGALLLAWQNIVEQPAGRRSTPRAPRTKAMVPRRAAKGSK